MHATIPWVDLEAHDFQRRLQEGDATCGWRGDPNMKAVKDPTTGCWAIIRNDDDGEWRAVLNGKHRGARLGPDVLKMLAERDQHRERAPYDPVEAVIQANLRAYAEKRYAAQQRTGEAAQEFARVANGKVASDMRKAA